MDPEDLPSLNWNVENGCSNSNCEIDSDYTDIDSDESMQQGEPTTCLFCTLVFPTIEEAIDHVKKVHKVNFSQLKAQFEMDQYSFIKLINCIRIDGVTEDKFQNLKTPFWTHEKYLKPLAYEPWLSYDFEYLQAENLIEDSANERNAQALIEKLKAQIKLQQDQLEQFSEGIETMRKSFHRVMEEDDKELEQRKNIACVSSVSLKADEGYFHSYSHFGIHHEMLSDVVRTTSYRDSLFKNKNVIKDKYVLDLGCGTSILSIFASQAGAAKVVGIDNSDIIYTAMDIIKKNNINNVTLVKGRLEDTELPEEKYDIVISEWMGYFLLFEGMLDSVIYARDHHLKENGIVLPNRCTMSILGYSNKTLYDSHVTFWNNVYGLDMSNIRKKILQEPLIDIVDADHILTDAACIADLDLMKVDLNYSNFKYNFEMICCKDGELYSFVGYFDTYFKLPEPVMFGTSPKDEPTHWKQVVFFIEEPQQVKKGDVIRGVLECKRSRKSARSLDIIIDAFNRRQTYYLD